MPRIESKGTCRRQARDQYLAEYRHWQNQSRPFLGSCSACHARHDFSKAQAREPEACGKCHLGPDHPQIEVYQESKHGTLYAANKERLNLHKDSWIVGKDYSAAPTCTTCHMGATPKQASTHDVGARISWTLRPPISKKLEDANRRRDISAPTCGMNGI